MKRSASSGCLVVVVDLEVTCLEAAPIKKTETSGGREGAQETKQVLTESEYYYAERGLSTLSLSSTH